MQSSSLTKLGADGSNSTKSSGAETENLGRTDFGNSGIGNAHTKGNTCPALTPSIFWKKNQTAKRKQENTLC